MIIKFAHASAACICIDVNKWFAISSLIIDQLSEIRLTFFFTEYQRCFL